MTLSTWKILWGLTMILSQSFAMAWEQTNGDEFWDLMKSNQTSRKLEVDTTGPAPTSQPATAPNPDLMTRCGLRVMILLDRSQSIYNADAEAQVQEAALAFICALIGTGSEVGIIEFGTTATLRVDYTVVTEQSKTDTFEPYINGIYPTDPPGTDFTNWDDAFDLTSDQNDIPDNLADLVVFITDGNPTAYNRDYANDPTPGVTNSVGTPDPFNPLGQFFWRAIDEANCVKEQGSRILGVAVGGVNQINIQDVTGPNVATDTNSFNIETTDVLVSQNFIDLETALRSVVFGLCSPSVTITKLFDGMPQEGITFLGSLTGDGYQWESPDSTNIFGGPSSGVTDAAGILTFQWDNDTGGTPRTLTVSEQENGFVIAMVECTKISLSNSSSQVMMVVFDTESLEVDVDDGDIVTCTVTDVGSESPSSTPSDSPSTSNFPSTSMMPSLSFVPSMSSEPSLSSEPSVSQQPSKSFCTLASECTLSSCAGVPTAAPNSSPSNACKSAKSCICNAGEINYQKNTCAFNGSCNCQFSSGVIGNDVRGGDCNKNNACRFNEGEIGTDVDGPPSCSGNLDACGCNTGVIIDGSCHGKGACDLNSGLIQGQCCYGQNSCFRNTGEIGVLDTPADLNSTLRCCDGAGACRDNSGTILNGSCLGSNSCATNFGTIEAFSCIPATACRNNFGTIGELSCNANGSPCSNNRGIIGNQSCSGQGACLDQGKSGTIGNGSCTGSSSCTNNIGTIGSNSCTTANSCQNNVGTIPSGCADGLCP